jgi:hypothetical protein
MEEQDGQRGRNPGPSLGATRDGCTKLPSGAMHGAHYSLQSTSYLCSCVISDGPAAGTKTRSRDDRRALQLGDARGTRAETTAWVGHARAVLNSVCCVTIWRALDWSQVENWGMVVGIK